MKAGKLAALLEELPSDAEVVINTCANNEHNEIATVCIRHFISDEITEEIDVIVILSEAVAGECI